MTAQSQIKRQKNSQKAGCINKVAPHSFKIKLISIASKMIKAGLPHHFIVDTLKMAFESKGIADLMFLWATEKDSQEKDDIIADIQDLLDAYSQTEKVKKKYVRFSDLETIAKDIRSYKDSLIHLINQRGGVSKLSELTGIPQPSLSRFLNSDTIPRRATLLKIAKALNLNEIEVQDF